MPTRSAPCADAGHEIAAHGFKHEDVSLLDQDEERARLARTTEILDQGRGPASGRLVLAAAARRQVRRRRGQPPHDRSADRGRLRVFRQRTGRRRAALLGERLRQPPRHPRPCPTTITSTTSSSCCSRARARASRIPTRCSATGRPSSTRSTSAAGISPWCCIRTPSAGPTGCTCSSSSSTMRASLPELWYATSADCARHWTRDLPGRHAPQARTVDLAGLSREPELRRNNPPHSYGEVSASYADGGVISPNEIVALTPPSRITAPPPHLNGEDLPRSFRVASTDGRPSRGRAPPGHDGPRDARLRRAAPAPRARRAGGDARGQALPPAGSPGCSAACRPIR